MKYRHISIKSFHIYYRMRSNSPSAAISCFDMYSIGIGPSSSHTVGPMRAAQKFAQLLNDKILKSHVRIKRLEAHVYGSLALTGFGHNTFKAIQLGLTGELPDTVNIDSIPHKIESIRSNRALQLNGHNLIPFDPVHNIHIHRDKVLPHHSNGMTFVAYDINEEVYYQDTYYSIGGGFFVDLAGMTKNNALQSVDGSIVDDSRKCPYPFKSAADMLAMCRADDISVAELAMRNELSWRSKDEIERYLGVIWNTMSTCIERGTTLSGVLDERRGVKRRSAAILRSLQDNTTSSTPYLPVNHHDYVVGWALAVSEENAAGGRVVTAPTNGAAGIIPAVIKYYTQFFPDSNEEGIRKFLLTASLIGMLFKDGASISGAEVGCQGEVGVATSMAAAGLTAALGGSNEQIENAAEIGMEHSLGLTCDPIDGLVQIPCIERNGLGASRAVTVAHLALRGTGNHVVGLDTVIKTMWHTGQDMRDTYKETSLGGLAANITFC